MDLSRFFSHAQIGRNEEFDAIPAQLLEGLNGVVAFTVNG